MRIGLETAPISCLQLTQLLRLWFTCVNREALIDEEIPDFFSALARVERFVLGVFATSCRALRNSRLTAEMKMSGLGVTAPNS